jgi:cell division protein FtsQ
MHERIRDRRRAVDRQRSRRRRRRIGSVTVLLVILAAGVVTARSPLFDVTEVRVQGVEGPRADEARRVAGVGEGDNLVTANLGAAAERVTALPWVRAAEARRTPPSTVTLRVTARVPVAVVELPDAAWLVDGDGVVVSGGERDGLPVIDAPHSVLPGLGVEISDAALRNALAVQEQLPEGVRTLVQRYEAPSDDGLRLHLTNDVVVRFGRAERVEAKARSIRLLLDQASDQAVRRAERMAEAETPTGPDGEPQPQADADGSHAAGDLGIAELDVRAPDNPVLVPAADADGEGS